MDDKKENRARLQRELQSGHLEHVSDERYLDCLSEALVIADETNGAILGTAPLRRARVELRNELQDAMKLGA